MSKMSQLHSLMVDEGLPVEACPEILRVFKSMVSEEQEAV